MALSQVDECGIVVEEFAVLFLLIPIDGIDVVGRLIAIVHALLAAEHFFAGEYKRSSLRCQHYGLSQFCHLYSIGFGAFGHRYGEFVGKAKVVVARHIVHYLLRRNGIRSLGVIALRIVDLRMGCRCHNTYLHSFLVSGLTACKTRVFSIGIMALHSIANIVAEHRHALHLSHIHLQSTLLHGQWRVAGSPTFAVDESRRIDGFQRLHHIVHSAHIVNSHKVESEAIDMIFLSPIAHRFHYKIVHHLAFAGCFVAATRSVAKRAIAAMAIVIARRSEFEIAALSDAGVIIHHIHHHAYASLMQRLHHKFHLANAHIGVDGIGGIRAVGGVIIDGIVAPVILIACQIAFVNAVIVERRQYVHVGNAQFLQVVDTGLFAIEAQCAVFEHCHKFSFVRDARIGMHREVAMMHLIEHHIGETLHLGTAVFEPATRIGGSHIDDGGTLAIHPEGFSPHTGCLIEPFTVIFYLECIELVHQRSGCRHTPHARSGIGFHLIDVDRFATHAVVIYFQSGCLRHRRPQAEFKQRAVDTKFHIIAGVGGNRSKGLSLYNRSYA